MNHSRWLGLSIGGVLVASLATFGCGGGGSGGGGSGDGGSTGPQTYVAQTEGNYIAILSDGDERLIYITDGEEISYWVKAPVGYVYTTRNDPNYFLGKLPPYIYITGTLEGNQQEGFLTIGSGGALEYAAEIAKGDAGLYVATEGGVIAAWIVLNDGTFRGARTNQAGDVEPLPSLGGTRWTNATSQP
jgi:hypothetical protein